MNDHDWQQAYNAGKRDAERDLTEALELIAALTEDGKNHGSTPYTMAKIALDRYKGEK